MNHPRRTLLLTGADSGLGRGLNLCLANTGHPVLVTGQPIPIDGGGTAQ